MESSPKIVQKAKARGLVSVIHFIAGRSLIVKGIIVSVALAAGYGSVLYYKTDNAISDVAAEVVQLETGVPVDFTPEHIESDYQAPP